MSRFKRKNRKDIDIKLEGGFLDVFDNAVKEIWRINDEEYDFICSLEDEYIDALAYPIDYPENVSISGLKNALYLVNKGVQKYYLI